VESIKPKKPTFSAFAMLSSEEDNDASDKSGDDKDTSA
jgi:hypothetical protein